MNMKKKRYLNNGEWMQYFISTYFSIFTSLQCLPLFFSSKKKKKAALEVLDHCYLQGNKLHQTTTCLPLKKLCLGLQQSSGIMFFLCSLMELVLFPGFSAFTKNFWVIPTLYLVKILYRIDIWELVTKIFNSRLKLVD